MDPLITVDQLATRVKPIVLDPDAAALAVANASGMVRAISGQTISFVADETVELDGGGRVLTLPERPVVVDDMHLLTVVEASYFGSVELSMVEGRDFERLGNELTRGWPWYWGQHSRLMGWPFNRPLGIWAPKVRVTYSHGYQTIPDDVVSIVLDVAQVLSSNPAMLRSETIGAYSVTYATETLGVAMVESIRSKLSATGRKRGAFSVRQS